MKNVRKKFTAPPPQTNERDEKGNNKKHMVVLSEIFKNRKKLFGI
jgi:hypothetical protein